MSNVLLVQSKENESPLESLLLDFGYEVESFSELGDVLKGINSKRFDLVLCSSCQGNHDGFYVFKSIKSFLEELFIPFFLVLEREVLKEELMIVHDLGIDNVIFKPFQPESIKSKLERALKKKTDVNLYKVLDFKTYFQSTLTPMIWVKDEKIQSINYAVGKIFGSQAEDVLDKKVEQVFELKGNESTRLSYFKFKHQVANECYLNSISAKLATPLLFDLFLFRGKFSGISEFLMELKINSGESTLKPKKSKIIGEEYGSMELTARENEVFHLSEEGFPLKLIAEKLQISRRTVERHRANIMQKTNSNSMIEAISKIRNYEFHNS